MTTPHFVSPADTVLEQQDFEAKQTPQFLLDADIVFQADRLDTMWLGPGRTNPIVGTLDEEVEAWDNIGSLGSFVGLAEVAAADHAFYTPNGINGNPTLRGNGTTSILRGTPGTAFTTASGGLTILWIGVHVSGIFNEYLQFGDSATDDFAIESSSGDKGFSRNNSGNTMSVSGMPKPGYMFMSVGDDGTVAATHWDVSASTNTPSAAGATAMDLSTIATLTVFGDFGGVSSSQETAELFILDRVLTLAEIQLFKDYCLNKYALVKA